MWDDFYNEPSEFDEQVEEFKESLRAAVKEEIKQEMERLREENASLWEIKNNWNAKVQELEASVTARKIELNKAIRDAEIAAQDAKRSYLRELLADCSVFAYTIHTEYIQQPKCDLCDQYRMVEYTTPLGRKAKEDCKCKETKCRYHVKKVPLVIIRQNYRDKDIIAEYLVDEMANESFLKYASEFQDETPFEEIKRWKTLFHSENRARCYAEWLNRKEADDANE